MTQAAVTPTAEQLRDRMVEQLLQEGSITDPAVEAAVRRVPRELFTPAGTDLSAVYAAHEVVITKRDAAGRAVSSVSAPWLQTRMIEQARLRPGARVLEIGSGGYNAALLAEVVGPAGAVTTLDIDPDVVTAARTALATAGHPEVSVVQGDAEHGHPPAAPYDAVIVTVEAATVPAAWVDQLGPDGVLVVPLRMRGNTRSLALTRHEAVHLAATSMLLCGFVPMQGEAGLPQRRYRLHGDATVLQIDDDTTAVDHAAQAAALHQPRQEAWSPVTMPPGVSFESLLLWLASQNVPYGHLLTDHTTALVDSTLPTVPVFLSHDSLAYLALRRLDATTWQFGAHGHGPDAAHLAAAMNEAIGVWDRQHRHGPDPRIEIHHTSTPPHEDHSVRLVLHRRHTTIVIAWPDHRLKDIGRDDLARRRTGRGSRSDTDPSGRATRNPRRRHRFADRRGRYRHHLHHGRPRRRHRRAHRIPRTLRTVWHRRDRRRPRPYPRGPRPRTRPGRRPGTCTRPRSSPSSCTPTCSRCLPADQLPRCHLGETR